MSVRTRCSGRLIGNAAPASRQDQAMNKEGAKPRPRSFFGFCRHKPFPAMCSSLRIQLRPWRPCPCPGRSHQGTERGAGTGAEDAPSGRGSAGGAGRLETGRVNIRQFLPSLSSLKQATRPSKDSRASEALWKRYSACQFFLTGPGSPMPSLALCAALRAILAALARKNAAARRSGQRPRSLSSFLDGGALMPALVYVYT